MRTMKLLLLLLIPLTSFAQDLTSFSQVKVVDEEYGFEVNSYNAKEDDYSIEASFGAITNLSEFSETNTISGMITIYSEAFSYTLYGAMNSLNIAAVTPLTGIDATMSVMSAGAGFSRRSIMINDFININSIYDEIQTNLTYNMASSDDLAADLAGIGMNASYGLVWRISNGMHLSARLVYNLMTLESSEETIPLDTTASWVSAQFGAALIF